MPIPLQPDIRSEEEQFYDTEADEEHLEVSGVQLSGTKEAMEDPPEDEGYSKRTKMTLDPNAIINE